METFTAKLGSPLYFPPGKDAELVVIDCFDGHVVFGRKAAPDDDLDSMVKEAKQMRRLRLLTQDV